MEYRILHELLSNEDVGWKDNYTIFLDQVSFVLHISHLLNIRLPVCVSLQGYSGELDSIYRWSGERELWQHTPATLRVHGTLQLRICTDASPYQVLLSDRDGSQAD